MHKLHKNRLKEQSRTSATDSLKVAQVFVKEHKNVIRAIRNMLVQAENSTAQNCAAKSWFYESTYIVENGKVNPMFVLNIFYLCKEWVYHSIRPVVSSVVAIVETT